MRYRMFLLLAALALPAAAAAQDQPQADVACEITVDTTDEAMAEIQRDGLEFAGYDTLCPLLRDAGMGVAADGSFGTVADRSYALIVVRLYNLQNGVRGWRFIRSTSLSEDTAEETAGTLISDTLNNALQAVAEMPIEMISSVGEEIVRLRPIARAPVAPTEPELATPDDGPCRVPYSATDEFLPLLSEWSDISFTNTQLCQRLRAAGAGLRILEDTGELSGRTYGWVRVNLYDRASQINSNYRATTISLAEAGVEGSREAVLREALLVSLENLQTNQDEFFLSLTQEMAAVRLSLGGQPGIAAD